METKTKYILATIASTLGSAGVIYAMSRDVKSAAVAGVVAGAVTGIAGYVYYRGSQVATTAGLLGCYARMGLYMPAPVVKKFPAERSPRYYS